MDRPARRRAARALHGTLAGALLTLLWAGLVRIFLLHHVTWSINSVCHFFGTRRFDVDGHSTNVFWLAIPSLGESRHHNHHAFPRSASHGLRAWELDPSAGVIWAMERFGLVSDVVRIKPERQLERQSAEQPESVLGDHAGGVWFVLGWGRGELSHRSQRGLRRPRAPSARADRPLLSHARLAVRGRGRRAGHAAARLALTAAL